SDVGARGLVAGGPQRPGRESTIERMLVTGGSIPFRSSSTVWVVDPDNPGSDLRGGKVHAFGYDRGQFILEVDPDAKGAWSFRAAYGREVAPRDAPGAG